MLYCSYGVSVTTLEEVFLRVASEATDHKNLGHLGRLRRESSHASDSEKVNQQSLPRVHIQTSFCMVVSFVGGIRRYAVRARMLDASWMNGRDGGRLSKGVSRITTPAVVHAFTLFLSRLSFFWNVEGSAVEDNKTEKPSSEGRLSEAQHCYYSVGVVIFWCELYPQHCSRPSLGFRDVCFPRRTADPERKRPAWRYRGPFQRPLLGFGFPVPDDGSVEEAPSYL